MIRLLYFIFIMTSLKTFAQCPVSVSTPSVCGGQADTILASGATTYSWYPSNGLSTTTGNSVTASNPSVTTVYHVIGTTGTCTASASFTVYPSPTASITSQSSSFSGCAPVCVSLQVNSNTNCNFYWDFGDGTTSNSSWPYHCYTIPGNYTVTMIATDQNTGCASPSQDSGHYVVYPHPSIGGSPIVDSATCGFPNGSISGLAVTGGTPTYYFQWYLGSNPVTGATSLNLTNAYSGTYSIMVTDANGCPALGGMTTFMISDNCTGVDELYNSRQVVIYPNPTSDQFFINVNTNDKLTVDLYDVNGRHVFNASVNDKSNISVDNLNEGVYSLTIKTADRVINKKLVIIK